jgi:hypothetical protein
MERVKDQYDAWDKTERGCGPLIIFILALLCGCLYLFGCNDNDPVCVPPVDTTRPEPIDTVKTDTIQTFYNSLLSKTGGENITQFAINIHEVGVKPENTAEQNTKAFEDFIFSKPEGFAGNVFIPTGKYQFANELKLYGRPIHLFGENGTVWGYGTHLHFPKESMGIVVLRGNGYQEAIIENIGLFAPGNTKEWMDGIVIRGRITLRNVYVKGFYNGIEGFANIVEGNDMSGSFIAKCFAAENTNDGFLIGRTDGNAVTVLGCDARDNGRYGFNDDSFLGNNFISCMAHYNKGGDFYVRDKGNARSLFAGCYSEGGNKQSELGPHSTVVGGTWGTGYTK